MKAKILFLLLGFSVGFCANYVLLNPLKLRRATGTISIGGMPEGAPPLDDGSMRIFTGDIILETSLNEMEFQTVSNLTKRFKEFRRYPKPQVPLNFPPPADFSPYPK